ncbi:unnamed protein product [Spodoptera exigua]|nr:unnamed protein product [Spodoptera exigua]
MVSNQRRPWTLAMEDLRVRCRPFRDKGFGDVGIVGGERLGLGQPHSDSETQRCSCFTQVFCEAVVSLLSSRPIRADAWLSHTFFDPRNNSLFDPEIVVPGLTVM